MIEVALALLIMLLGFEAKAWFPRLLIKIVCLATQRLPPLQRERYREEWMAHLDETPGAVMKLWQASGFVLASGNMFPSWHQRVARIRFRHRRKAAERVTLRALDLFFSTIYLLYFGPVLIIIILILSSGGRVFDKRKVEGRNGVHFFEVRFSTCNHDFDDKTFRNYVCKFIRLSSLDNLPLIINVLRSEMTFFEAAGSRNKLDDRKPGLMPMHMEIEPVGDGDSRSILYRVGLIIKIYLQNMAIEMVRIIRPKDD